MNDARKRFGSSGQSHEWPGLPCERREPERIRAMPPSWREGTHDTMRVGAGATGFRALGSGFRDTAGA
jgi:hypothetical protein